MSSIDEIMSDVQSFASTWALAGGRFDDGSMHNTAEAQSAELRNLIAAALADARREGAREMRARILSTLGVHCGDATGMHMAVERELSVIDALPLPAKREPVLLTDAEMRQLAEATLYSGSIYDRVRAIEAAVLAKNGLEAAR